MTKIVWLPNLVMVEKLEAVRGDIIVSRDHQEVPDDLDAGPEVEVIRTLDLDNVLRGPGPVVVDEDLRWAGSLGANDGRICIQAHALPIESRGDEIDSIQPRLLAPQAVVAGIDECTAGLENGR